MEIKFLIDSKQRKPMANTISELAGYDVEYLGAPSFAYRIGDFTLDKDAVLSFSDRTDTEIVEKVLDGLYYAGYKHEEAPDELTLEMPREDFTDEEVSNLKKIIANKARLIKHALGCVNLDINVTDEKIEFPWFILKKDYDAAPNFAHLLLLKLLLKLSRGS